MIKPTRISLAILIISFCVLIGSCEKKQVPVLETSEISNITGKTATSGGTITDEGSGTIISRGVCWSTGTSPTIADNKTSDGAGAGSFTSNISELNGATKYFVRAYATNSVGTGYGMAMSFTTLGQAPSVTTLEITNIAVDEVQLNGTVNANYLSTEIIFEYGTTTSYGSTVTATQSPVTGNTITNVSATITGLTAGITYHLRIKAVNSLGTAYGNDMTFVVQCMYCKYVTYENNNIINEGTESLYCGEELQVQLIKPPITIGSLVTKVQCTSDRTQVIDVDGNYYRTVKIGTQTWMGENLKTTKFNDGTNIPLVADGLAWTALSTSGYCWYDNTSYYKPYYGALYNWYTINTNKLCPTGWHVPTTDEWTSLTSYLGSESVAGGKLKDKSTSYWLSPNSGATNESGFTALPGGCRYENAAFSSIRSGGGWWSSTAESSSKAWYRGMSYGDGTVYKDIYFKSVGFSVRCIKD